MALYNSTSTNGAKMILNDQLVPKRDFLINGGSGGGVLLQGGSSILFEAM